ncbi:MAG: dihydropteroate synthase [Elusimicrobiota bacterium]
MRIRDIVPEKPAIMGVLNITSDSFYDGGNYLNFKHALSRARQIISEGAHIIDIGGESTRPGASPVAVEIEKKRVIPLIKELANKNDFKISCDTSKPAVAEAALEAGAVMINDVRGMRDSKMMEIAAKQNAAVCIMHMKGNPGNMQKDPSYSHVLREIKNFLLKRVDDCIQKGIPRENIILDPGIGFGKTLEHNLKIISNIKKITGDFPVLAGVSRKSFIGAVLNKPVGERLAGSLAAACYLTCRGADMLRVHDVKETVDAVKIIKALKRKEDG